jgi:PmbA protein
LNVIAPEAASAAGPEARLEQLADISRQLLDQARRLGATQAEVSCSEDRGLDVNVRLGEVETVESTADRGIAVTVYFGQRKGSASTADLQPASLLDRPPYRGRRGGRTGRGGADGTRVP